MSGIKIKSIGSYLPEQIVTNEDMCKIVDTTDEWITTRTGVKTRHKVADGQTQCDLAVNAARRALDAAGIKPEQIGVCLVATLTPHYITPSTACFVQGSLGFPEDTVCFDFNAACSGFVFGLHTIQALLAGASRKYGLVIGAEVITRITDYTDRSTCILFGDGAGAAVVEYSEEYAPLPTVIGTRGTWDVLNGPGVSLGKPSVLYMEGQAVYKFSVSTAPKVVEQLLQENGLTRDDIDYFVFHQANLRIIDAVCKHAHIPPEKCYTNIDHVGNTSSACIPIALDEMIHKDLLHSGSKVLCVGFGGGFTWGGTILEF